MLVIPPSPGARGYTGPGWALPVASVGAQILHTLILLIKPKVSAAVVLSCRVFFAPLLLDSILPLEMCVFVFPVFDLVVLAWCAAISADILHTLIIY